MYVIYQFCLFNYDFRITQLYTRWSIYNERHESERQQLKSKSQINFNDHHTIILEDATASRITAHFLDNPFIIEVRAVRLPLNADDARFYDSSERPKETNDSHDFVIAVAKIDASALSKGMNALSRGEFSLYPAEPNSKTTSDREDICTNDLNRIGKSMKSDIVIQPSIILGAQMTLEVSIGYVGCKPEELIPSFSRLYCFVDDSNTVMAIVRKVTEINDEVLADSERDNLLTGFVLDIGDRAVIYIEGRRHGPILQIWNAAEHFFLNMKTSFSSSSNYATRLYPEMVTAPMPFTVLKMHVPLAILLACPQVYVRPTLPLPARSAVLKFGRLLANELRTTPSRNEMPCYKMLQSFRLELCSPPRPGYTLRDINFVPNVSQTRNEMVRKISKSTHKIND
ncbi:unnamed protein product [Leptosia nina]|uniref:Uncharacterized protein n=1 Tax=Leptosia nina TaxID=320188 RepID=A0AAV1K0S4_9NEOP